MINLEKEKIKIKIWMRRYQFDYDVTLSALAFPSFSLLCSVKSDFGSTYVALRLQWHQIKSKDDQASTNITAFQTCPHIRDKS